MTRDTKIGLLLGLVFIFIIAFLINGIPWLRGSRQGSGPAVRTNRTQPITPGATVREVAQNMGTYNRAIPIPSNFQVSPTGTDVRSVMPLPVTYPSTDGLPTSPGGTSEMPGSVVSSTPPSMPGQGLLGNQPPMNPGSSLTPANGVTPVAIPVPVADDPGDDKFFVAGRPG